MQQSCRTASMATLRRSGADMTLPSRKCKTRIASSGPALGLAMSSSRGYSRLRYGGSYSWQVLAAVTCERGRCMRVNIGSTYVVQDYSKNVERVPHYRFTIRIEQLLDMSIRRLEATNKSMSAAERRKSSGNPRSMTARQVHALWGGRVRRNKLWP